MPIYRDRGLVFVHIPKTGGTTVVDLLGCGEVWGYDGGYEYSHATGLYLSRVVDLGFYRAVCLVRNPYERLLSEYFWKLGGGDKRVIDCSLVDFGGFVDYLWRNFDMVMGLSHLERCHFMAQVDFLVEGVEVWRDVDGLVGDLCRVYGLAVPVVRSNVSVHGCWEGYYDDGLRRKVRDIYYRDFIGLGF